MMPAMNMPAMPQSQMPGMGMPMMMPMMPSMMMPNMMGMMPNMMGMMPNMMGMMPNMMMGMMPMTGVPMMCRMTVEMGKDGMICKLMPPEGTPMDMLRERCDAITKMMAMGIPMAMMCGGQMLMGMAGK